VPGAAVLTAGACIAAFAAAAGVLASGEAITFRSAEILPLTGVSLSLDPLGAIFVITTAVVGLAVSCYAAGYAASGGSGRTATALLPLFITSLLLVPAAASVATFMAAWELMALSSLLLLLTGHRRSEARDAAQWYAGMTHVGAGAILIALVLLSAHAGGQSFAAIRAHAGGLSPAVRSLAFLLALAGFASKAGAVPLHVWLPRAHPEAPGPVSALMSGAMVNLGIYGIVRTGDGLLGGGQLWWWLIVAGRPAPSLACRRPVVGCGAPTGSGAADSARRARRRRHPSSAVAADESPPRVAATQASDDRRPRHQPRLLHHARGVLQLGSRGTGRAAPRRNPVTVDWRSGTPADPQRAPFETGPAGRLRFDADIAANAQFSIGSTWQPPCVRTPRLSRGRPGLASCWTQSSAHRTQ
jgi:hypothetical protein